MGVADGYSGFSLSISEYSWLTSVANGSDCCSFDIFIGSAGIRMLIGCNKALDVLSNGNGNRGGVKYQILNVSFEMFWDQILLVTL